MCCTLSTPYLAPTSQWCVSVCLRKASGKNLDMTMPTMDGDFCDVQKGKAYRLIQPCGWLGTHDLWGGNVSDTAYNEDSGYLQEQAEFQEKDQVNGKVLPFTVVLDKGYRARAACWRHGKQLTAQPAFAKSDKRFKASDTLTSASIASDRGGNERGVNVSKRCGVIKRGFKAGMDTQIFQDTWITWSYQANFMSNPVL